MKNLSARELRHFVLYERAGFETWAKEHGLKLRQNISGSYLERGTNLAWLAWLNRATGSAPPARSEEP